MSAWPWPGDTQTDVARRVVGIYRAALQVADQRRCDELDGRLMQLGQDWVVPEQCELNLDDEVSVAAAARYVGRAPWTIYDWIEKGWLTPRRRNRRIFIRLSDLFDAQRELRERRTS